ncbi:coiled-coil domain-containing protein domain-containing protein [Ditylenchus destructor]|uniref:Coiled-coil domain-containing protein domain-containing protein n=1 Tax=Ditylenchus destructor TaxID=166010 RepID=A0AAD4N691_9BILA|nr:coiled-coil domain-containing protein domain-containing protein [Ditylenchus destructor]
MSLRGARDTARDIILGAEPSGRAPRQSREAVAVPLTRSNSAQNLRAMNNLQSQLEQVRRQQADVLNANEVARRRLEANQEALSQRLASTVENVASRQDMEQLMRSLGNFESKVGLFAQELANIKGSVDRQAGDIMTINNEVKNRPVTDPKLTASTQLLEQRLRELHNQLIQMKLSVDTEIADRVKANQSQADLIARLQEYIRQQEASKNDILANIARKNDLDKERLSDETKRLNDRIQLISIEVTKNMNEREQKLREDLTQKYNAVQESVKNQLDSRLKYENEVQRKNDERYRGHNQLIDDLRGLLQQDRTKSRDRFQRVNEALAALEHHLELGNRKMDKIINAEIQSRKLHEKGLLGKVDDLEVRLNNYLNSLAKTVEDVRAGVDNIKIPVLDTDALRRDMEAIASDKTKMSMEGLLKLEERISRIQYALNRDRRELHHRLGGAIEKEISKRLKKQVEKLDILMQDIEGTQSKIRDKVERQIPEDLGELAAKVDNLKSQMTLRIDSEEEERYLAIKELQEAYGKIASGARGEPGGPGASTGPVTSTSLKRDIEECKVAIKKLAESVTTVKNVLDRKVQEEIRKREQDVEVLSSRLDSLTIQGLQQLHH